MNINIEFPAIVAISSSLLRKQFIDGLRADGKRAYRVLEEGKPLLLADLKAEDGSAIRFSLELLAEEFRGRLNFSTLRQHIEGLCRLLEQSVSEGKAPRVMSDESGQQHAIFVPLFSELGGEFNALLLAVDSARQGELRLQLMYVDPAQFRRDAA